jgi:hypothetical protein
MRWANLSLEIQGGGWIAALGLYGEDGIAAGGAAGRHAKLPMI